MTADKSLQVTFDSLRSVLQDGHTSGKYRGQFRRVNSSCKCTTEGQSIGSGLADLQINTRQ